MLMWLIHVHSYTLYQPHVTNLFPASSILFCLITLNPFCLSLSLSRTHTHNPHFFSLTIFAPSISPVMALAVPSISHLHGNSPATGWPLMANESMRCPGFSSNGGGGPGELKVNAQGGVSTYILVYLAASIAQYLFHSFSLYFLCFWIIWMQKCNTYFFFSVTVLDLT